MSRVSVRIEGLQRYLDGDSDRREQVREKLDFVSLYFLAFKIFKEFSSNFWGNRRAVDLQELLQQNKSEKGEGFTGIYIYIEKESTDQLMLCLMEE